MSLDHGQLNVPLAKRGNIDAQIDKYKAEQAAIRKANRMEAAENMRVGKARAKVALAEMIAAHGLLDAKAAKAGMTRATLVAVLTEWSKWEPSKVIKAHTEWMANRECKCSLRTKLVGDGCEVCNPDLIGERE